MTKISPNMVAAAKEQFTTDIMVKTGIYLDETKAGIYKATATIVPIVFSGLLIRIAGIDGAALIAKLAQKQKEDWIGENIGSLTGDGGADLMRETTLLLGQVFEKRSGTIIKSVAELCDIRPYSSSTLLSLATPVVLSILGKYMTEKKLSVAGMVALLNSQKSNIIMATPPELNMKDIFGESAGLLDMGAAQQVPAYSDNAPVAYGAVTIKILLAALLLALIGLIGVFYFRR